MSKIITIANSKGGVGKTTTAIFLATLLSRHGRVLLKDADAQGSATEWLEDIAELPFDYEIANIRSLAKTKQYDYVIIDTPPQNSEMIYTAIDVADFVIIPAAPSALEVSRVLHTVEETKNKKDYKVLLVQVDTRTNSYHSIMQLLANEQVKQFNVSIPKREGIKKAYKSIPEKSILLEYEKMVAELMEVL